VLEILLRSPRGPLQIFLQRGLQANGSGLNQLLADVIQVAILEWSDILHGNQREQGGFWPIRSPEVRLFERFIVVAF
jgi:hypothetical protein